MSEENLNPTPEIMSPKGPSIFDVNKITIKKLLIKFFILAAGILLIILIILVLAKTFQNTKPEEKKTQTEKKDESVIPNKKIGTYKIYNSPVEAITSFIYQGEPDTVFSSHTAYYLSADNRLIGLPFFISAESLLGKSWCQGNGKNAFNLSYEQTTAYCLENVSGKEIILRKLDIKNREYKEYAFASSSDLFSDGGSSNVVSSRDGDTALIYSPAGAFIFDSVSGNLYKTQLPLNLSLQKAVHISNVELALISSTNKLYRVNFSNRKSGIFDVNFIGLTDEQLTKGLKTARLSKDGRRIIFTISDVIEALPKDLNVNYQSIVAYNVDLYNSKVSDELAYDEKFLASCKFLISEKFCIYRLVSEEATQKKSEELFAKEFNGDLVSILKIPYVDSVRIKVNTVSGLSNFAFIKSPLYLEADKFMWVNYSYNASDKSLKPLTY